MPLIKNTGRSALKKALAGGAQGAGNTMALQALLGKGEREGEGEVEGEEFGSGAAAGGMDRMDQMQQLLELLKRLQASTAGGQASSMAGMIPGL